MCAMRDLASQINPKVVELLQQTLDSAGSGDGLPNNLVQVSRIVTPLLAPHFSTYLLYKTFASSEVHTANVIKFLQSLSDLR